MLGDAKLCIDPFLEGDGLLRARGRDRVHGGGRARQGRDARHAPRERRLADRVAVRARVAALRRVDHEIAAAAADEVDDRRLAVGRLAELPHRLDLDSRGGERGRRPLGRVELEAEPDERRGDRHGLLVVGLADGDEDGAGARQPPPRGPLGLVERGREVGGARHHLTGRAHLRAEHRIAAREACERQHRGLDAPLPRRPLGRKPQLRDRRPEREAAGGFDELDAGRLADERHRPRGARVRLDHVHVPVAGHRELDVEEPDRPERAPEDPDDPRDLLALREREARRGQDARRVARVDARLLDVLHDRRDVRVDAVAERVDVHLDRVLDEAVDEDRARTRRHLAHLVAAV